MVILPAVVAPMARRREDAGMATSTSTQIWMSIGPTLEKL
jgi:hypothetical protein